MSKNNILNNKVLKGTLVKDTVYTPQEDSYILAKQVSKYAIGNVLDMGCGSGIQGITALNNINVRSVTFCDINIKAINYVKESLRNENSTLSAQTCNNKKISFIVSDLFNKFSRVSKEHIFDTIIFNPPYLPDDDLDDEKLITTGGKKGHELIEQFLTDCKPYLRTNGIILMVFSSLTSKTKVDNIISKLGYSRNQLAMQGLFMEQLYVYMINRIESNILKGHRGIVEIKFIKRKGTLLRVAVKSALTEHYNPLYEAKFLKLLNKKGIGPKYISCNYSSSDNKNTANRLIMGYVDGERIMEYFNHSSRDEILKVVRLVFDQLLIMDTMKINKMELTNPYKHIIVSNGVPIQIDFERCTFTDKPKNVTQFMQFLSSGKLGHIFSRKSIKFNNVQEYAQKYKKSYDKKYVEMLLRDCS